MTLLNKTLQRFIPSLSYQDKWLWLIFFGLCLISGVEVFSASSALVTSTKTHLALFSQHTAFLLVGMLVAGFFSIIIPAHHLKGYAMWGTLIGLIAIGYTSFAGAEINGARRWIEIFSFTIQTSEFYKPFYIAGVGLALSYIKRADTSASEKRFYGIALTAIAVVSCVLIGKENGSMAILYALITLLMVFYSDISIPWHNKWIKSLLAIGAIGVLALLIFVTTAYIQRNDGPSIYVEDRYETALIAQQPEETEEDKGGLTALIAKGFHRIETWNNRIANHFRSYPIDATHLDINDDTSQEIHARLAIANSNGGLGVGIGKSRQRDHLSLAYSDFIGALIIEEMGLWGIIIVLTLYALLIRQCAVIGSQCSTPYHAYTAIGIGTSFGLQVLTNMFVAVGIIPITGQTLPIISHGGSSILANSLLICTLLIISRYNKKRMAYETQRKTRTNRRSAEQQEVQDTAEIIMPAPAFEA